MQPQVLTLNGQGVGSAPVYNRVPKPTWDFWLVKLLAVTVGETFADFLSASLGLGLSNTTIVMSGLLVAAVITQFSKKKYIPWIYWITVVLVSVVGTLITDKLVDDLGVALGTTTMIFSVGLAATFAIWYAVEKTLSIHTVYTFRREAFYWMAILLTFALGTSAGDQAAEGLGLGYLPSALMYAAIIAVITLAYFRFGLNEVFAFWAAYVLTRPMGASLGDWFSQPVDATGLGFGTVITSFIFLAAIGGTVAYMTLSRDGDEKAAR